MLVIGEEGAVISITSAGAAANETRLRGDGLGEGDGVRLRIGEGERLLAVVGVRQPPELLSPLSASIGVAVKLSFISSSNCLAACLATSAPANRSRPAAVERRGRKGHQSASASSSAVGLKDTGSELQRWR